MDEAPFPTTSPPPGSKASAAAAAAAAAGKGGKAKVELAANARPGSPGSQSGEQFIASWHGKQGSLREQFGGGGTAEGGSAADAEQCTPTSSPRPSVAAAAAADRAELLRSRSGSPASGRPRSPLGRSAGSSTAARDVEAANRAELLPSPQAASSKGSSSSPAARGGGKGGGKGGGSRLKGLFKVGLRRCRVFVCVHVYNVTRRKASCCRLA